MCFTLEEELRAMFVFQILGNDEIVERGAEMARECLEANLLGNVELLTVDRPGGIFLVGRSPILLNDPPGRNYLLKEGLLQRIRDWELPRELDVHLIDWLGDPGKPPGHGKKTKGRLARTNQPAMEGQNNTSRKILAENGAISNVGGDTR